MFTKYTSLIIPTRNRNDFLLKILSHLRNNRIKFQEIIVIDSSDDFNKLFFNEICKKFCLKFYHTNPSTSAQRNLGLKLRNKKNKFVMFLDDDIFFFKKSFSNMNKKINILKKNNNISGFGFNLITKKKINFLERIKLSKISKLMNLYSDLPGVVTKSGWHTKILNVNKDVLVDWCSTQAVIYKSKFLRNITFDENLGVYSYLEDLDFSLRVNKKKKILISCNSKYKHLNDIERNNFTFGIIEIFNRFLISRRNNLNLKLFFFGSFVRFLLSILNIFIGEIGSFFRASGNIIGIIKSLFYLFLKIED